MTTWTVTETAERLALMDSLPLPLAEQVISRIAAETLPTWSETADWTPGSDIPDRIAVQLVQMAHYDIIDHPVQVSVTDEDDQPYAGTRNIRYADVPAYVAASDVDYTRDPTEDEPEW